MKKIGIVSLLFILIFFASCSNVETDEQENEISLVLESGDNSQPDNYASWESTELSAHPQSTPEPPETELTIDEQYEQYGIEEIDPTDFTGIWHISPGPADGYADRYVFATDGTFIFIRSDMDAATRERAFSGIWEIAEGQVVLTIQNKIMRVGGDPFPPFASVASEYEIIGGMNVYIQLAEDDYEVRIYEISDVFIDMDLYQPIRSVFINGYLYLDFNQFLDIVKWYTSDDILNAYTRLKVFVPVADTFDYEAAAGFDAVFISGEMTEREDVFNFPYIMMDDRRHHVQVVRADMVGDGKLETIIIYYGVTTNTQGDETINAVRIMIDNGQRQNIFRFFMANSEQNGSVYFVDLHGDGRLSLIWQVLPHWGSTDIITYDGETGLRRYSLLGEMEAWSEGRIYTTFNRLLDNDNTFVSYFDLERGLIPFETERVAGREISFPFAVPILRAQHTSYEAQMFIPQEHSYSHEWLQRAYGNNLLASIPAGETLTIIDFEFYLRGDRYEVFPWVKLETADGQQGWLRIIDN